MENNQKTFNYTYSAQQQEEVESIRKKYMPAEESKMERLRRLHHSATKKAQAWAIGLGVTGALVMGGGMSIAMTELTGLPTRAAFLLGIPVGLVGMVMLAAAHPVYMHVLKKERQRIAPEILRLSEELLK